jgi:hypothetical protein
LPRITTDDLRWLAEATKKSFTHPPPVKETGLPGDLINAVSALLHHKTRGFKAKIFNRLRGRMSGFRLEGAAELTRTKPCNLSQIFNR